jgi:hypothetical protein
MNLFLVNYRTIKCERLKSITRLSEKEAFEAAAKLYEENHRDTTDGFQRFADFDTYYPHRIKTEKWLYDQFIAAGGKPQTRHPLYFFVHEWDAVERAWDGKVEKVVEKIALDDIDPYDVSFVMGDSMKAVNQPDDFPLFMKDELLALINSHDNDINKLLDFAYQQADMRAIEAHIWNDKYFKSL